MLKSSEFWFGVSCLVLVRVFFVYVKICLPFPKLALGTISQQGNNRFFFLKSIKLEVLVSVWWLVRACPWAPGCFETSTFC